MLAHHPETGQPIRILKTSPTLYSDGKTLVWIRAGFVPSERWGRWNVVVSEPAAVSVCGAAAVGAVVLDGGARPEDWRGVWSGLFEAAESSALFVAPSVVVSAFDKAGLRTVRTFVTEDLYDSYPYLGEPLAAKDPLSKVVVSMAHILRHNRIAWTEGVDRDAFSFGLRAQLDAWGRACCDGTPALLGLTTAATDAVIPRTWLIQQYYLDSNHRRAREIRTCLERNLACAHIDHILLLNEQAYDLPANPKLQTIILGHRLRYYDVFVAARAHVPAGDYVVFANSDIYFNETLAYLWKIKMTPQRLFLALLRWEEGEPPTIFGPRADSQDAWMLARDCMDFEPDMEELGFPFGKPGCDNAISLIMMRKRFMIANPAYSIKTLHLHASQIRRYNPRDVLYRPQFLYIEPSAIQGFSVIGDMSAKAYKPPAAVNAAWTATRLGQSFPRAIVCDSDASTVCSMLRREGGWSYTPADANLWTPPPSALPLYRLSGGTFVSAEGLVCNFKQIYTGGHAEWVSAWESASLSTLMPCIHVPNLVAVPFKAEWGKSLAAWALHYLPRALAVREAVRAHGGGAVPPEFLVPQDDNIGAFLADCKWSGGDARGNITVVPFMDDSNYFADDVWAVPPTADNALPTQEDVAILRGLLPVTPACEYKPIVVFCVEEDETAIVTRTWAESVAENLFHTGWVVRYVDADTMPAARRKAFADASWIFGGAVGLEWIWMAGAGATVMEFVREVEPRGDIIHLAGAAGLRYILGPVKKEPLLIARQNALLATAAAIQRHGFRELVSLKKSDGAKPVVVLPSGAALSGIHSHVGDTFREMAEIWGERGYVTLERSDATPYVWYGGIGQTLLYDRPTARWWPSPPPSYQMALFGNCAPPGPGPHLLKQSVWCFWGRRPRLLEGVAARVENMRGYESRPIKSLFIGKIENGVQHAARSGADWSTSVELFSMPIDSTGKPYPYSAEEYLGKLCLARFGLSLPGYGPKCNREVEYFCCGVVPIVTPCVDMKGFLVPPVEGRHYFRASTPAEVRAIVETTSAEKWAEMSAAGREWWRTYASAEGLFRITEARVEQCRPYLNVGIPAKFEF